MSMIQLLAAGKSFRDGKSARHGLKEQTLPQLGERDRSISGKSGGETDLFGEPVRPVPNRDSEQTARPGGEGGETVRRSLFRMPSAGMTRSTRAVRTAEQAELALESVRVVRNDLSDSDLELVPASNAETAPTPQRYVIPMPPKPGFWQRITGWLEARV